jgi:hypothetical protein
MLEGPTNIIKSLLCIVLIRACVGRHELFPNKIIPNVKILNPENGKNPEHKNPKSPHLA